MKKKRSYLTLIVLLVPCLGLAAEQELTADEIVQGMLDAAGGYENFRHIGLLGIKNSSEEMRSDGNVTSEEVKSLISTNDLVTQRYEKPGLVLGADPKEAWALVNGKLDERQQPPAMARATMRGFIFPFLLPYSLKMPGVTVTLVDSSGTWDDRPCWYLKLTFTNKFFAVETQNTTWNLFVDRQDFSFIATEYFPEGLLRQSQPYGIRYRYERYETINGVKIPALVLMEGLTFEGLPTGHTKINNLTVGTRPWDTALFLSPKRLQELEEGDVLR